jgi:hypothetical protein
MDRFDEYTDTDLDNPEHKGLTQVVGLLTMPLLHLSAPAKKRQVMQLFTGVNVESLIKVGKPSQVSNKG